MNESMNKLFLAGDVGGTKTDIALFAACDNVLDKKPLCTSRFRSGDYDSLEEMVNGFITDLPEMLSLRLPKDLLAAAFGVAGPVKENSAQVTNLPWHIDAKRVARICGIPKIVLCNDLEVLALSVPYLDEHEKSVIWQGEYRQDGGDIAVVAPGTGLGVAFGVKCGDTYRAIASEGGHTSFAPVNELEIELLRYMLLRYDHVSFEKVCSGLFFNNICAFIRDVKGVPEPKWLLEELQTASDKNAVYFQAAIDEKAELCVQALQIFLSILSTKVGDVMVTLLPSRGVFLGGGLSVRLLPYLKKSSFMQSVLRRGRFSSLCETIPVSVITAEQPSLYGSALFAMQSLAPKL